ncbi:MAG: prepilin-type N-terminal cleavage/methylation domain-containing protein [Candidatus Omnitrophica bacterium]|nr:prepilin-type N-terminal cleavage/methylation domain-containing protein [Candidatus Omnitrophota bacterium]
MEKGFTLLELIVVIVILGILATLGFTQYTRITERMRAAEAVAGISAMRKFVHQYWLENGTLTTITNSDVGVGSSSDQIPSSCRNTNYFFYSVGSQSQSSLEIRATRCTSGGKSPNYTTGSQYQIGMTYNPSTGSGSFWCYDYGVGGTVSWCVP